MSKPERVAEIRAFYWDEVIAEVAVILCDRFCVHTHRGYCGLAHYAAREVLSLVLRGHQAGRAWADTAFLDCCVERDMALAELSATLKVGETA